MAYGRRRARRLEKCCALEMAYPARTRTNPSRYTRVAPKCNYEYDRVRKYLRVILD